jgi:hypothetical protein
LGDVWWECTGAIRESLQLVTVYLWKEIAAGSKELADLDPYPSLPLDVPPNPNSSLLAVDSAYRQP